MTGMPTEIIFKNPPQVPLPGPRGGELLQVLLLPQEEGQEEDQGDQAQAHRAPSQEERPGESCQL